MHIAIFPDVAMQSSKPDTRRLYGYIICIFFADTDTFLIFKDQRCAHCKMIEDDIGTYMFPGTILNNPHFFFIRLFV
jgi:hypothetical protein